MQYPDRGLQQIPDEAKQAKAENIFFPLQDAMVVAKSVIKQVSPMNG